MVTASPNSYEKYNHDATIRKEHEYRAINKTLH